jgi:integrase/recombinase XerD
MAKFSTKGWNTNTDNPKLLGNVLADGRISLYLRYNYGSGSDGEGGVKVDRVKEFLKLYLVNNPRTPLERQQNKDTFALAQEIKKDRGTAISGR